MITNELTIFNEKKAKAIQVNEMRNGRNVTLKGYEENGRTVFDYDKGTSGVVYGYGIHLNEEEKKQLLDEALKLNGSAIHSINDIKGLSDNFYPLYWGKSELILGRLNAHLKGHKKNGNLHLGDYTFFQGKDISYYDNGIG